MIQFFKRTNPKRGLGSIWWWEDLPSHPDKKRTSHEISINPNHVDVDRVDIIPQYGIAVGVR